MMWTYRTIITICFFIYLINIVTSVELTFDLADNAEECFYEVAKKNETVLIEFQVTAGGQMDVDVTVRDPMKKVVYEQQRSSFDSHQFNAPIPGVYAVCFSNKFSTFSHKLVYMDFQIGEETPLPGIEEHATVLTQLETSAIGIHNSLNSILDYQTHHRLREAQGRKRAEDINERVLWWAVLETAAVLLIGIGQVLILRNFFTDRKPGQGQFGRI